MRKDCWECCMKHLGTAATYIDEFHQGYPNFKIFVIGELNHASTEILKRARMFSLVIREHRVKWYSDPSHCIPFESLGNYITMCEQLPDDSPVPDPPDECLEGLERDEQGAPCFSTDNRP